jgi:hypothetical protein
MNIYFDFYEIFLVVCLTLNKIHSLLLQIAYGSLKFQNYLFGPPIFESEAPILEAEGNSQISVIVNALATKV